VCGRIGGNSPRSVGLAIRGRDPRASGRKVSGLNAGGGWICVEAGGWEGRRSSAIMSDRYSLDEGGDCDMDVKGSILDGGELDGEDCSEENVGEEDMGVDERQGGYSINGPDSIKLKSSE
jgi:hypothetical protein